MVGAVLRCEPEQLQVTVSPSFPSTGWQAMGIGVTEVGYRHNCPRERRSRISLRMGIIEILQVWTQLAAQSLDARRALESGGTGRGHSTLDACRARCRSSWCTSCLHYIPNLDVFSRLPPDKVPFRSFCGLRTEET